MFPCWFSEAASCKIPLCSRSTLVQIKKLENEEIFNLIDWRGLEATMLSKKVTLDFLELFENKTRFRL